MTAAAPEKGDRITIRWPGGPHDFVMDFAYESGTMPAPPVGWFNLHGRIVEPADPAWGCTTLFARFVSVGVYEMVPRGGTMADLELRASEVHR